jgi:hypothetical protein
MSVRGVLPRSISPRAVAACGVIAALILSAGPAAADEPAAPPAAPAAPAATAPSDGKSVLLHVKSPSDATVKNADTGEVVCTAPCDQKVPEAGRFQIVSGRPTQVFALSPEGDKATLSVRPASNTKFWLGVGATGLGTGLAAAGAAVLVYAVGHKTPIAGGDGTDTSTAYTDRMSLGAGLAIAGVVAGVIGVATIISNARSKVRGDVRSASNTLFVGTF